MPSRGYQLGGNKASLNNRSLITYKGRDTDTAFSASAEEGYRYHFRLVEYYAFCSSVIAPLCRMGNSLLDSTALCNGPFARGYACALCFLAWRSLFCISASFVSLHPHPFTKYQFLRFWRIIIRKLRTLLRALVIFPLPNGNSCAW